MTAAIQTAHKILNFFCLAAPAEPQCGIAPTARIFQGAVPLPQGTSNIVKPTDTYERTLAACPELATKGINPAVRSVSKHVGATSQVLIHTC